MGERGVCMHVCMFVKDWFKPIFPLYRTRLCGKAPNTNGPFCQPPSVISQVSLMKSISKIRPSCWHFLQKYNDFTDCNSVARASFVKTIRTAST